MFSETFLYHLQIACYWVFKRLLEKQGEIFQGIAKLRAGYLEFQGIPRKPITNDKTGVSTKRYHYSIYMLQPCREKRLHFATFGVERANVT